MPDKNRAGEQDGLWRVAASLHELWPSIGSLQCDPPAPTARERLLHEMGVEYHDSCERYDQVVCSHRTPRGVAMPGNHEQRTLIQRNADRVMSELLARPASREHGITRAELMRAVQDAAPDGEL